MTELKDVVILRHQVARRYGDHTPHDSPLVLLTALQTLFEPDSASSLFCNLPAPYITDEGLYDREKGGRTIRVYATIDNRTMFEDMCAKFLLHSEE